MECTQAMDFTQCLDSDPEEETDEVVGWLNILGQMHELKTGSIKLGRDPMECDIAFENKDKLSKEHALFEVKKGKITLCDLGSRNKSKMNDLYLEPHVRYALQGGETLKFGDVTGSFMKKTMSIPDSDSEGEADKTQEIEVDKSSDVSFISPSQPVQSSKLQITSKSTYLTGFVPETPFNETVKKTNVMESPPSFSAANLDATAESTEKDKSSIFQSDESTDAEDYIESYKVVDGSNILKDLHESKPADDIHLQPTQIFDPKLYINPSGAQKTDKGDTQDVLDSYTKSPVTEKAGPSNETQTELDSFTKTNSPVPRKIGGDTQSVLYAFASSDSPGAKKSSFIGVTQNVLDAFTELNSPIHNKNESGFKKPEIPISSAVPETQPSMDLGAENQGVLEAFKKDESLNKNETQDILEAFESKDKDSSLVGETQQVLNAFEKPPDPPSPQNIPATQAFEPDEPDYLAPTQLFVHPSKSVQKPKDPQEDDFNFLPTQVDISDSDNFNAPTQYFKTPAKQVENFPKKVFYSPCTQTYTKFDDTNLDATQIFCDDIENVNKPIADDPKPDDSAKKQEEICDISIDIDSLPPTQIFHRNDSQSLPPTQLFQKSDCADNQSDVESDSDESTVFQISEVESQLLDKDETEGIQSTNGRKEGNSKDTENELSISNVTGKSDDEETDIEELSEDVDPDNKDKSETVDSDDETDIEEENIRQDQMETTNISDRTDKEESKSSSENLSVVELVESRTDVSIETKLKDKDDALIILGKENLNLQDVLSIPAQKILGSSSKNSKEKFDTNNKMSMKSLEKKSDNERSKDIQEIVESEDDLQPEYLEEERNEQINEISEIRKELNLSEDVPVDERPPAITTSNTVTENDIIIDSDSETDIDDEIEVVEVSNKQKKSVSQDPDVVEVGEVKKVDSRKSAGKCNTPSHNQKQIVLDSDSETDNEDDVRVIASKSATNSDGLPFITEDDFPNFEKELDHVADEDKTYADLISEAIIAERSQNLADQKNAAETTLASGKDSDVIELEQPFAFDDLNKPSDNNSPEKSSIKDMRATTPSKETTNDEAITELSQTPDYSYSYFEFDSELAKTPIRPSNDALFEITEDEFSSQTRSENTPNINLQNSIKSKVISNEKVCGKQKKQNLSIEEVVKEKGQDSGKANKKSQSEQSDKINETSRMSRRKTKDVKADLFGAKDLNKMKEKDIKESVPDNESVEISLSSSKRRGRPVTRKDENEASLKESSNISSPRNRRSTNKKEPEQKLLIKPLVKNKHETPLSQTKIKALPKKDVILSTAKESKIKSTSSNKKRSHDVSDEEEIFTGFEESPRKKAKIKDNTSPLEPMKRRGRPSKSGNISSLQFKKTSSDDIKMDSVAKKLSSPNNNKDSGKHSRARKSIPIQSKESHSESVPKAKKAVSQRKSPKNEESTSQKPLEIMGRRSRHSKISPLEFKESNSEESIVNRKQEHLSPRKRLKKEESPKKSKEIIDRPSRSGNTSPKKCQVSDNIVIKAAVKSPKKSMKESGNEENIRKCRGKSTFSTTSQTNIKSESVMANSDKEPMTSRTSRRKSKAPVKFSPESKNSQVQSMQLKVPDTVKKEEKKQDEKEISPKRSSMPFSGKSSTIIGKRSRSSRKDDNSQSPTKQIKLELKPTTIDVKSPRAKRGRSSVKDKDNEKSPLKKLKLEASPKAKRVELKKDDKDSQSKQDKLESSKVSINTEDHPVSESSHSVRSKLHFKKQNISRNIKSNTRSVTSQILNSSSESSEIVDSLEDFQSSTASRSSRSKVQQGKKKNLNDSVKKVTRKTVISIRKSKDSYEVETRNVETVKRTIPKRSTRSNTQEMEECSLSKPKAKGAPAKQKVKKSNETKKDFATQSDIKESQSESQVMTVSPKARPTRKGKANSNQVNLKKVEFPEETKVLNKRDRKGKIEIKEHDLSTVFEPPSPPKRKSRRGGLSPIKESTEISEKRPKRKRRDSSSSLESSQISSVSSASTSTRTSRRFAAWHKEENIILDNPAERQAAASSKPKVMFTGFTDNAKEHIVKDLGGTLVDTVSDCTVLVADGIKRTCKLLSALGKGIPIVSTNWLVASKDARNFVDPWKYLIKDKNCEKKFSFNLRKSLESASKNKLFTGYSFFVTNSVKPPSDQLKEIIECSGGENLSMPPKIFADKLIVISCEEDKRRWNPWKKLKIPIVNTEFIMTGLIKHQILLKDCLLA